MFLSNKTIKEYIDRGKILVKGEVKVETKGISLHLGDELLLPKPYQIVDSKNP